MSLKVTYSFRFPSQLSFICLSSDALFGTVVVSVFSVYLVTHSAVPMHALCLKAPALSGAEVDRQ